MVSCVSPYYPNITKYENILVVDGMITNLTGPYNIKLSRTFKYDGHVGDFITGANIKIIDNTGVEIILKEIKTGEYSTVDTLFHGIPGRGYKLQIKIDNDIFESNFEVIKPPIPIDKLNWEYKAQDGDGPNRIQLSLDTHDPTNNTRYYGWEYIETWKFQVPIDVSLKPSWKTCYQNNLSTFINLGSSIERNNDIIEKQNLTEINESSNKLYIRYSILAKQYSFSEQTFKFIADLKNLNQNQGTLFDVTPYSIKSNISCVNNKNIPVVGYFIVAGATEKRIFIDKSELPKAFRPTSGYTDCSTYVVFVDPALKNFRQNHLMDSLMNQGYSMYDSSRTTVCKNTPPPGVQCTTGPAIQILMAKSRCYNCTVTGYNEIPKFWKEKNN
jgi:hypothetical protein